MKQVAATAPHIAPALFPASPSAAPGDLLQSQEEDGSSPGPHGESPVPSGELDTGTQIQVQL